MKFKITIYAFLLIIICCFIFKKNDMKLEGDLIIPTPSTSFDDPAKILKYNLEDKSNIIVYEHFNNYFDKNYVIGLFNPSYNYDKNKIIFFDFYNVCSIFEYDVKTNNTVKIIDLPFFICCLKYVPNSNCISYIVKDEFNRYNFEIYNLETAETRKVFKNISNYNYSWSNDGKSFLYYTSNDEIFRYNLEDNTSEFLFNGSNPVYSNDNKYIAYFDAESHDTVLIVRNMETGEEKRHKQSRTYYICFSPKDDKIACIRECFLKSKELVIWDFETDEEYTLIDNVRGVSEFDWK